MSASLDGKFGAHADIGPYIERFRAFNQDFQFSWHFQDKKYIETEAFGPEPKINKFSILVSIADNTGFCVVHQRHSGDKFSLGSNFKTMMVSCPKLGYLIHNLLLLIDLDGENPPVFAHVAKFLDSLAERLMNFGNAGRKNILHAQQDRHIITAFTQAGYYFEKRNLRAAASMRADYHLAVFGNIEISRSPCANAIKLHGIFHSPLPQSLLFRQFFLPGELSGLMARQGGCYCIKAGRCHPVRTNPTLQSCCLPVWCGQVFYILPIQLQHIF